MGVEEISLEMRPFGGVLLKYVGGIITFQELLFAAIDNLSHKGTKLSGLFLSFVIDWR